ncbi:MAG: glycosyltransferase [Euryarchaeota archaeon]|nr:glycosyltransferase [Euryarchaeota archaeon]
MRRRPRASPTGTIFAFMLLGVVVGAAVEAGYWILSTPGQSPRDAPRHVGEQIFSPESVIWNFILLGGLLGFLLGRFASGEPAPKTVRRHRLLSFLVLLVGALIGAVIGLLSFAFVWTQTHPGSEVRDLVERPDVLPSSILPLVALTVVGATIGMAVAAYLMESDMVTRMARAVAATLFGALAGILIYGIAYAAVNYPQVPDSPAYFLHIGEGLNALNPLEFFFAGFGGFVGLLVSRHPWRFYGVVTLISLVSVVTGFLGYSLVVTLPRVEDPFRPLALTLFVAEAASLTLVVLYSFYTIDVATRKHWLKVPAGATHSRYFVPRLAVQVPTFNEPADLVLSTLRSLMRLDYPRDRLVIMVLDDSTRAECAEPLEAFCRENSLRYYRRRDRVGYKAGALNYSLQFVPDDVDFLAVVDADYQVEPDWLRECVGYFADENLAWVQTPQDYRNRHQSFLTEQYYLADAYFYRTVMPSRNEENTIIFCGTMGILRKKALLEVGGWGEKYISEDAELSLRLATHGWDSLYVNKTFGRGLIPPTFDGYKKQHYRWAFGGAKILRGHFWDIVFGRLSRRQSFDYFVGSAHWFEGIFVFMLSAILILLGIGELTGLELATHHSEEVLLIGLVPFFLLADGLTRLHMVMRENMSLSLRQTLRVLGMWFSVKFSNAFAATKSLIGFTLPFVRTPKAPDHKMTRAEAVERAVRVTRFESTMALIMLLLAFGLSVKLWSLWRALGSLEPARLFLAFWIMYYSLIYLAGPLYAYKSYVTFRPDDAASAPPIVTGVPVAG